MKSKIISKKIKNICCIFFSIMAVSILLTACGKTQETDYGKVSAMEREIINFNTGWLYSNKDYTNGELFELNDSDFESVSIPHANKILETHKGPDFQNQIESYRFVSWYRRHFVLGEEYKNKNIIIEFEGVATVAQVYVNGKFVGDHKGAYTSFSFDITKFLNPVGEENIIAVRVDSTKRADIPPEGGSVDYCLFGGIVRDINMIVTGDCYIDNTYITTPGIEIGLGKIHNETLVKNTSDKDKEITVETYLVDADGNTVVKDTKQAKVKSGEAHTFKTNTNIIKNPILWSTDNPYLYTVVTRVLEGETCIDDYETKIGLRWFAFKNDAFYLNGEKIELIGVNRHEQWPYLGRAANNKAQMADADLIKETGFNAVRCSHYPQDPSFLSRCDEIGLIVFEEAPGWQYIGDDAWKEVYKTNIEEMIIRDRNHPSIVSWGTRVNESWDDDSLYNETNKIAKELDPSRPTHGVRRMESYGNTNFLKGEDIYTVNYQYPEKPEYKPFIITEHSMDWYDGNGFSWASDEKSLSFTKSFASVVDYYFGNKYCLGGFAWSMFDYNNEVNYTQTDNVFYSGLYDIFRLPKMPSYFYKSQKDASDDLMVYIANYWTENSPGAVTVFSNCEEVELYVNGKFIEKKTPTLYTNLPHPMYEFENVQFEAGELTAVGYVDGKEVARFTRNTPKEATRLVLTPEHNTIIADGSDFTTVRIDLVDENGTVLPYADNEVTITLEGVGNFIGEEKIKLEGGKAAFFVQSKYGEIGKAVCTVSTYGIQSANCEIEVKEFTEKTIPTATSTGNVEPEWIETIDVNDSVTGDGLNQFAYSGTGWGYCSQPGCNYADNHYSNTANDICTFKFNGTNIKLFASVANNHGIMAVSIDGGDEKLVDLYNTVRIDGIEVFDSGELESKEHTITIRVTDDRNVEATDNYVTVDKVTVFD